MSFVKSWSIKVRILSSFLKFPSYILLNTQLSFTKSYERNFLRYKSEDRYQHNRKSCSELYAFADNSRIRRLLLWVIKRDLPIRDRTFSRPHKKISVFYTVEFFFALYNEDPCTISIMKLSRYFKYHSSAKLNIK